MSTDRTFHVSGLPLRVSGTTFVMNDLLDLPAQPLTLRIGVSSRLLGRTGTTQITVDVPKATDDRLQIGGVVLGSTAGPEATQAFDVIRDTVPFQPTTSRVFSTGDTIRVWASLLWSGKDGAVDATVSVPDAPAVPRQAAIVAGVTSGGEGHWQGTLDVTVPVAGLTPGAHGLQIEARLPSGQMTTRLIAFDVKFALGATSSTDEEGAGRRLVTARIRSAQVGATGAPPRSRSLINSSTLETFLPRDRSALGRTAAMSRRDRGVRPTHRSTTADIRPRSTGECSRGRCHDHGR